MAETHVVTALVAKHAEISGELAKLGERRAAIAGLPSMRSSPTWMRYCGLRGSNRPQARAVDIKIYRMVNN
jgi:hypothetical protein